MGAPEAIPFGSETGAAQFSKDNGGSVVRLDQIPESYVLGSVELSSAAPLPAVSRNEVLK
jgi:copper chaperone NosL